VLRLLHIALFLAGAFAFYIGAFAYSKGLRIGNKLDDWWGHSGQGSGDFASLIADFFSRVAGTVEIGLIRCVMEKVYDPHWIMFCASLPLVSFLWTLLAIAAFANSNHPEKLLHIWEDEDSRNAVIAAFALLPIAWVVAALSKLFLALIRFIALGIVAIPILLVRGLISIIRGDFAIQFPTERVTRIWNSIRDAPASWRIPAGLKAWVVALHTLGVRLVAAYTMLGLAIAIPCLLLAVLALTLPFIALWFGGLGWLELGIVSKELVKFSKPTVAVVIAAGVLPAAACLFTLRWNLSRCFATKRDYRVTLFVTLGVLLLSSLLCFGPFLVVHHLRPATAPGKLPIGGILTFVALCNGFNVLICYSLVAAGLLLILHRWTWPHLRHWLMALRLAGVAFSRKFYVVAGLVMLVTSAGGWELWHTLIMRPELYQKFSGILERVAGWF
jgi:hypothetical protein